MLVNRDDVMRDSSIPSRYIWSVFDGLDDGRLDEDRLLVNDGRVLVMRPFPTVMADEAVIIETIDVSFIVYCICLSLF